jgi:2-polyprenyl-6-methoxyphenol hydroxylase-like FAD-dependent oxidoreductase
MTRSAVIIGSGIGGLAAARALIKHGWQTTVYERAGSLPTSGTMLAMWPHAMRALELVGAADAVRRHGAQLGVHAPDAALRTADGRVLIVTKGRVDPCMISRPDLLAALADGVHVTFGSPVDHPADHEADVIIGADGIFSRTRQQTFGDHYRARSLGAVAWRGTIPGTIAGYGETWAPGALFGTTPTGLDATNYYACVRADGPFPGPHLNRLRELFGDWPAGVQQVLARLEEESILHHELFETPRLRSYVRGSIALLGDAAHAMGPFLGRGACEALVDGVTLGESLAASAGVEQGLADYDRSRRRRTQRLIVASRTIGGLAMLDRGHSIRNALLGAAGRLTRGR